MRTSSSAGRTGGIEPLAGLREPDAPRGPLYDRHAQPPLEAADMGGTIPRNQELEVIRSGGIQYKHAEIQEASVRFIGTTAILLNRIRLDAVVGGNEVSNPFVVTEVYVQQNGTWKLGSLSFTRLLQ
ncbi:MAG TPA: nuclear transport factor 2 family protein [Gemmatimonadaceae bacterium]|nr:nuclear transport factor 2 family protein [Gemmatimonadaceae bacterium]